MGIASVQVLEVAKGGEFLEFALEAELAAQHIDFQAQCPLQFNHGTTDPKVVQSGLLGHQTCLESSLRLCLHFTL